MSRTLEESLKSITRTFAANSELKAEIKQLPTWPKATRGTPNSFLRGALFAAIQGKNREYMKDQLLASRDGIKIRFTGLQLDQSDLDVWEQAVELARASPLGNFCQFHIYSFLKDLGRATGKKQGEWLRQVLTRFTASGVAITHDGKTYSDNMLKFLYDEEQKTYALCLNPKILDLYQAGWTAIDWEIRKKLRRKPLALWLHGYLSSDAKNYPTKVETLRFLSGSKTKELRHFEANLKVALDDLFNATGGLIKGRIESGLVFFKRTPSVAQKKYLLKKLRKPS